MAAAAAAAAGETPMMEEAPPPGALYSFGRPWPELNEGLSYTDTFRCADADSATTLIEFYSANYKSSAPLAGWIKRIHNGQITVDGEVVRDPDMTLRDGSKLVYHRLPWQEPFAPHLLDVLYEDDDMVALNKPSGLQVLPKGLFQQRTVLAQLQWKDWKMVSKCSSKRKGVQLHPVPVHRLGRGTSGMGNIGEGIFLSNDNKPQSGQVDAEGQRKGEPSEVGGHLPESSGAGVSADALSCFVACFQYKGLLLCAKTKIAKVQLASYFAEGTINAGNKRDKTEFDEVRKISKFYRALVTGMIENDEVVVTQPIGLVHYPGVADGLYAACSSGKPAMSKVCVIERLAHQKQTLVQVEIHSGRPHQIRIHLAYIGHPLVDDPLYGIGGLPKFDEPESKGTDGSFAYDGKAIKGLCNLFLETVGITCMHIGWSFAIQQQISMVKITAPLPPLLQTREERRVIAKQAGA
ncbi:hypothetical protein ACP70R_016480 [Stipagrostis hirtigluma subsp. patula]